MGVDGILHDVELFLLGLKVVGGLFPIGRGEFYVQLGLQLVLEKLLVLILVERSLLQGVLGASHRGLLVEFLALQLDLQVGVGGLGLFHLPFEIVGGEIHIGID